MPEEFKKTVNLRERMEHKAVGLRERSRQTIKDSARISKAEAIDKVYNDLEEAERDLRKISRPAPWIDREIMYKQIIVVLLLVIIGFGAYFFFFDKNDIEAVNSEEKPGISWYSVKLVNGEFYYGQIDNTGTDPIVLRNVYYNYDQINPSTDDEGTKLENANLRLVKRGKEAQGGDGSMNLIRTQVLFMEPLGADSKILKAILDYEK